MWIVPISMNFLLDYIHIYIYIYNEIAHKSQYICVIYNCNPCTTHMILLKQESTLCFVHQFILIFIYLFIFLRTPNSRYLSVKEPHIMKVIFPNGFQEIIFVLLFMLLIFLFFFWFKLWGIWFTFCVYVGFKLSTPLLYCPHIPYIMSGGGLLFSKDYISSFCRT